MGSRAPVIILTAHGDEDTRRQTIQAGAVAFLKKPFQRALRSSTLSGRPSPRRDGVSDIWYSPVWSSINPHLCH